MHQAYVELNGVRTKVVTYGRWIEESKKDGETDDIVIIIPGNPGVTGFYSLFAKTIHDRLGYPVWIVGHAGHNIPDNFRIELPKFEEHKELYGLKGQIEHKIDFFKKYVPPGSQVHLIGHSFGSYINIELIEHPDVKDKVDHVYQLFPAIEHWAETHHGKFLLTYVKPIVGFILFMTWIFTLLPSFFATFLLYIYMFIVGMPPKFHNSNIKEFLKPGVIRRVLFLVVDEIKLVKERNDSVIRRNKDKLRFYYSDSDKWTPTSFSESLKNSVPGVDVRITDVNHSFVFSRSEEVGHTVSDWILEKKEKRFFLAPLESGVTINRLLSFDWSHKFRRNIG